MWLGYIHILSFVTGRNLRYTVTECPGNLRICIVVPGASADLHCALSGKSADLPHSVTGTADLRCSVPRICGSASQCHGNQRVCVVVSLGSASQCLWNLRICVTRQIRQFPGHYKAETQTPMSVYCTSANYHKGLSVTHILVAFLLLIYCFDTIDKCIFGCESADLQFIVAQNRVHPLISHLLCTQTYT